MPERDACSRTATSASSTPTGRAQDGARARRDACTSSRGARSRPACCASARRSRPTGAAHVVVPVDAQGRLAGEIAVATRGVLDEAADGAPARVARASEARAALEDLPRRRRRPVRRRDDADLPRRRGSPCGGRSRATLGFKPVTTVDRACAVASMTDGDPRSRSRDRHGGPVPRGEAPRARRAARRGRCPACSLGGRRRGGARPARRPPAHAHAARGRAPGLRPLPRRRGAARAARRPAGDGGAARRGGAARAARIDRRCATRAPTSQMCDGSGSKRDAGASGACGARSRRTSASGELDRGAPPARGACSRSASSRRATSACRSSRGAPWSDARREVERRRRAPMRRRRCAARPAHRVQAPPLHGGDLRRARCRQTSPRSPSRRPASRAAWADCTTSTWRSPACARAAAPRRRPRRLLAALCSSAASASPRSSGARPRTCALARQGPPRGEPRRARELGLDAALTRSGG